MLVVKKKKKLQRIQPNRHISWFPLEIQLTQPSYGAVHPIFTSRTTTSFLPAALCCGCALCYQGIFPTGWEGALCALQNEISRQRKQWSRRNPLPLLTLGSAFALGSAVPMSTLSSHSYTPSLLDLHQKANARG